MAFRIGRGVVWGIEIKDTVYILMRDGFIDFVVDPLQLLLSGGSFLWCGTRRRADADRKSQS